MDRQVIGQLENIVGKEHVTETPEELLCYSYDGSSLEYQPAAVAFPANADEISAIMKLACTVPFPVVPRGAGTGMTAGALPVAGGLVLAILREYAVEASNQGYGTLAGETRDDCWSLIIYLVEHMTDDEIADALK